jgi:hypothetical protein
MNLPIGKLFYFVPKIAAMRPPGGDGTTHFAPFGAPGYPSGLGVNAPYSAASTSLYDQYYEQNEPIGDSQSDGLFDYSKGNFTAKDDKAHEYQWSGNQLIPQTSSINGTCSRALIVILSGFSSVGVGKLTGPD